jgi:hypothetical protein
MKTIKIGKWNAIIHYNEIDNINTILYNGNGGAIVSDADLIEAKRKFITAMQLSESVKKII